MSPAFGPLTFTASWSRLDPTGKSAFHIQSVRLTVITGSLGSRISDSGPFLAPKKGCMDNTRPTLEPGVSNAQDRPKMRIRMWTWVVCEPDVVVLVANCHVKGKKRIFGFLLLAEHTPSSKARLPLSAYPHRALTSTSRPPHQTSSSIRVDGPDEERINDLLEQAFLFHCIPQSAKLTCSLGSAGLIAGLAHSASSITTPNE
ncbi:hypothetical protein M0R45_008301 [Rubus argutus]|uniref:Uncharacterized protein n=1 Tax=Rubus argutus TaxID=59490 RepID=A0AAW1Y4I2_RUBAR